VWSCPWIGKLLVFITPLLDKSTGHRTHNAQEEAEKQYDIDANGVTWGITRTIARDEYLVYFDDK
jgi:hypothetical protein